jgi:hypothetical protein
MAALSMEYEGGGWGWLPEPAGCGILLGIDEFSWWHSCLLGVTFLKELFQL